MEVVPLSSALPPLDPSADPRTPLGRLRAGYLPIWSPDLDWAFPPEVCGSDWALDAIAEPAAGSDLVVLGDPVPAAALSVMRYEQILSRALARPDALGQLCVAVATVGPARRDALGLLASHVETGTRSLQEPGYPDRVTIVAASSVSILAVVCVTPGYSDVLTGEGEMIRGPARSRLGAYLLTAAKGVEDPISDVSFRVSGIAHRATDSCDGEDSWAATWAREAARWAQSGEIWTPVGVAVTVDEFCGSRASSGPIDCPRDWVQ